MFLNCFTFLIFLLGSFKVSWKEAVHGGTAGGSWLGYYAAHDVPRKSNYTMYDGSTASEGPSPLVFDNASGKNSAVFTFDMSTLQFY